MRNLNRILRPVFPSNPKSTKSLKIPQKSPPPDITEGVRPLVENQKVYRYATRGHGISAGKVDFLGVVFRPLTPPPLAPLGGGGTGFPREIDLVWGYKTLEFGGDISDSLGDIDVRKFGPQPSMPRWYEKTIVGVD